MICSVRWVQKALPSCLLTCGQAHRGPRGLGRSGVRGSEWRRDSCLDVSCPLDEGRPPDVRRLALKVIPVGDGERVQKQHVTDFAIAAPLDFEEMEVNQKL